MTTKNNTDERDKLHYGEGEYPEHVCSREPRTDKCKDCGETVEYAAIKKGAHTISKSPDVVNAVLEAATKNPDTREAALAASLTIRDLLELIKEYELMVQSLFTQIEKRDKMLEELQGAVTSFLGKFK